MAWPLDTEALNAGEVQLGFGLGVPAPAILEVVHEDWDWFFIDGQHGQFSYDTLLHVVRTADSVRTPSLVRVRDHSFGTIGPVLDMSCTGIIVPMVNTPQQAEQLVQHAKFPPLGTRSYGGRRLMDLSGGSYWETANKECLLFLQIETAEGMDNVEAIVEEPGVDGILVGPADLGLSLEMSPSTPLTEPIIADRLADAARAARAAGKMACCAGAGRPELAAMLADMGYTLLLNCTDMMLLRNASPVFAAEIREALASRPRN